MTRRVSEVHAAWRWMPVLAALAATGCAVEPTKREPVRQESPPPDRTVYFSAAPGGPVRSAEQQDRDRYECNGWAVRQTHFDPSLPDVAPHQRMLVVAGGPPPGSDVVGGAVTGALVGAALSNPWHAGGGILIGALAGAAIGGIVDSERTTQADHLNAQANADANAASAAVLEQRAQQYRRAMTACLEGRGYSVQ
jgi:hypothetical protein